MQTNTRKTKKPFTAQRIRWSVKGLQDHRESAFTTDDVWFNHTEYNDQLQDPTKTFWGSDSNGEKNNDLPRQAFSQTIGTRMNEWPHMQRILTPGGIGRSRVGHSIFAPFQQVK
jgi:hypothetical protein